MNMNTIRKAVAAIFGGRPCNGFVATTTEHAKAAQVPAFLLKSEQKPHADAAEVFRNEREKLDKPGADLERMKELLAAGHRIRQQKEAQEAREKEAAEAHRRAVAKLLPAGITFEDYAWGCIFKAKSKSALVKSGLVPHNAKPSTSRKETEYTLPLNHLDGYRAATFGKIPPNWQAKLWLEDGVYRVNVTYAIWRDLNVAERVSAALAEFHEADCDRERLELLIGNIAPRPLSLWVAEVLKAATKYPKSEK